MKAIKGIKPIKQKQAKMPKMSVPNFKVMKKKTYKMRPANFGTKRSKK